MGETVKKDYNTRFWSHVDKTDKCWNWKLSKRRKGYGQTVYKGRQLGTHRVAWMLTYGEIPRGMDVLHNCDNPACCRPDHLYLGTDIENTRDKFLRGRQNIQIKNAQLAARKLTVEQVKEIKEAIKNVSGKRPGRPKKDQEYPLTYREIARKYNVEHSTILGIKNNATWREV